MANKQHSVQNLMIVNTKVLYACGAYGYVCGENPNYVVVEKDAESNHGYDYKTGESYIVETSEQLDDNTKCFNTPYLVNHQPFTDYFSNYSNDTISDEQITDLIHTINKTYFKK